MQSVELERRGRVAVGTALEHFIPTNHPVPNAAATQVSKMGSFVVVEVLVVWVSDVETLVVWVNVVEALVVRANAVDDIRVWVRGTVVCEELELDLVLVREVREVARLVLVHVVVFFLVVLDRVVVVLAPTQMG